MSVINTPPRERMPVETYVMEFNQEILKMGIENELNRNGQVFFLYNRVKTIYEMAKYLEQLVPQARVVVAHGQMDPEELEDIIHDFIEYKYDILLTTTIIESGIDIPRANTIFIDRADRFGLAQLYQLRGRVGRSNLKAYAYLFYESKRAVSEDAMKKLRVISEYTELGSGFKVAMKDMEIRGAGNLLGPEQHGDILAVGFSMYCKLLSDAVREIQKKSDNPELLEDLTEPEELYLDIKYTGFIPDSYILDPKDKIEIYKKISGVVCDEDLEEIRRVLSDRYGRIPQEVERLLYLGQIRIICRQLGISEMTERISETKIETIDTIKIKFSAGKKIDVMKLMGLMSASKGKIYLKGEHPDCVFLRVDEDLSLEDKGRVIVETIKKL
jgi:transcription-repair coupling factor (superfamily II helicase)